MHSERSKAVFLCIIKSILANEGCKRTSFLVPRPLPYFKLADRIALNHETNSRANVVESVIAGGAGVDMQQSVFFVKYHLQYM